MLALLLDWFGGYLVAKKIRNIWLLLIGAFGVGILSSICGNLIVHFLTEGKVGETMGRIVVGFIWHPIVSIVAALVHRKRIAENVEKEPDDEERERRRQLTLEAQRQMRER
jgi:hypothetical protein